MTETVPFTEAKARMSDLVDRVAREHERIVITKRGRPAAVLISPQELEEIEETIDILQDEALMKSIRVSLREIAEGKVVRLRDHLDELRG